MKTAQRKNSGCFSFVSQCRYGSRIESHRDGLCWRVFVCLKFAKRYIAQHTQYTAYTQRSEPNRARHSRAEQRTEQSSKPMQSITDQRSTVIHTIVHCKKPSTIRVRYRPSPTDWIVHNAILLSLNF